MMGKKILISLLEEDWVEVIKLVEQKSAPEYDIDNWNNFNKIKTQMLFQFGMGKRR